MQRETHEQTSDVDNAVRHPVARKLWKWLRRLLLVSAALTAGLCLFGAIYHSWKTGQTERKYTAPGKLVDVGGHKLHYVVQGDGTPVVVIDAGMDQASYDWTPIQEKMAEFATVMCFDRAGHGWSEPGPLPRTSQQNVKELRTLLKKANLPAPYILCGHSYGGITMRLFASLYPEEVSALVLVDAANYDPFPDDAPVSTPPAPISIARNTAFLGTPRIVTRLVYASRGKEGVELSPMRMAIHSRTKEWETLYQEWTGQENWREVRRMIRPLGDLPVTVITGDQNELYDWWPEAQEALATSVSDNVEWVRLDCGHLVNDERPDAIVSAVRDILERIPRE